MLEDILLKIIHYCLIISLAALCSISCPVSSQADSLWKKSNKVAAKNLFMDYKASQIGDIVTILISENVTTTYEGESEGKKTSSVLSSITSLLFPSAKATTTSTDPLYQNKQYTGSRAGMHNATLPSSQWTATQNFKGDGKTDTTSDVQAKISARVMAFLPNDHFLIEGRRSVGVGLQEETIVISGIIRQEDIRPDNTIESQYIADAKIRIEGKGAVAQSTKKGVLTKMWEFLGLY